MQPFRGDNSNTSQYGVDAKFRERLAIHKQAAQKSDVERLSLRKLSCSLGNKYLKGVFSFGKLNDGDNINRTWENIKENI